MDATAQTPPSQKEDTSAIATLRRIGGTVLSVVRNRLELIAIELREEKQAAVVTLMLAVTTASLAVLSGVALLVTVAFLVPEGSRKWVMLGIFALIFSSLIVCYLRLKARLKRPPMLNDTLSELQKDLECLKES